MFRSHLHVWKSIAMKMEKKRILVTQTWISWAHGYKMNWKVNNQLKYLTSLLMKIFSHKWEDGVQGPFTSLI